MRVLGEDGQRELDTQAQEEFRSDSPNEERVAGAPNQRSIPSLDGLRALSVLTVVLAHSSWYLPDALTHNPAFQAVMGNGVHGVTVFFVISGFLITTLLLREFEKTDDISLRRFYFRRTLRIFPPFYFLLAVMGILWAERVIPEDWRSFVASATYTWAYFPWPHGYFIFHTWSLSIEEQFYLFWPFLFVKLHCRDRLVAASLALVVLMPILRIVFYFCLPNLRGHEFYMLHGWLDTMMVGCLIALLMKQSKWQNRRSRYLNGWVAVGMSFVAFYVVPVIPSLLTKRLAGFFVLGIAPTITACSVGGLLLYVTETKNRYVLMFLNNAVLRHVGILSYSLYLWQQMFLSHELALLPFGYLYVVAAAEASFWLVERPSLKVRTRLEAVWWPKAVKN